MKACCRKRPNRRQWWMSCVLGSVFLLGGHPSQVSAQISTSLSCETSHESCDHIANPHENSENKTNTATIQDTNEPTLKLSGFGTLGLVYNSSRQFDYLRDLLQAKGVGVSRQLDFGVDSLLGLQLSSNLNDYLDATVQTVIRRGENEFRPDVTWAFVKYYPNDQVDLRIGRLGFDVYPLADSRNVAYAYTWVRPPVEYFGGLIVSYIDGVDAVYKYDVGQHQAKIKLFAGKAREQVLAEAPGKYFSLKGSQIWGGHLELQSSHWLGRLGYTELRFDHNFPSIQGLLDLLNSPLIAQFSTTPSALAENLLFEHKKIRYLSAGLVYDEGPLQAQLMLSRLQSQTLGFNSNVAAFFTIAYRFKAWTPYFTLAKTRPLESSDVRTGLPLGINPGIDQLEAGVQGFLKSTRNKQSSLSLGLRYNLNQTSDIKFQLDRINNQERLITRGALTEWNGKATIISTSYNFIFN